MPLRQRALLSCSFMWRHRGKGPDAHCVYKVTPGTKGPESEHCSGKHTLPNAAAQLSAAWQEARGPAAAVLHDKMCIFGARQAIQS